ncbi:MAG: hypothetical protein HQM09_02500 [Candidatus Riflebacteria bacterium]|nr:hypothetical protein [Candidatus Riflebacteria bacterium]
MKSRSGRLSRTMPPFRSFQESIWFRHHSTSFSPLAKDGRAPPRVI